MSDAPKLTEAQAIDILARANEYLKGRKMTPLCTDVEFLRQLAEIRANPDKFDTRPPEAPAGKVYNVDIFTDIDKGGVITMEDDVQSGDGAAAGAAKTAHSPPTPPSQTSEEC